MTPNSSVESRLREYYSGRRVVVAGVTGFIGANCAISLRAAGAHVTGVARTITPMALGICDEFVSADLGSSEVRLEALANASVVFDCMGYSQLAPTDIKPTGSFDAVFRPTVNLVKQCVDVPTPPLFVHVSSRLVYGAPRSLPVDESHPLAPGTFYAVNKVLLENYVDLFSKTSGLRKIVFRLSSPYGPNAPSTPGRLGVWNQLISKAVRGEVLQIYGDGGQLRDLVFIQDVMHAFLLAAATPQCVDQTFNLGGERAISLRDVVTTIAKEAKTQFEFVPWPEAARRVETGDYQSDLSKLRRFVELPEQTSFEDGVRATIRTLAHGKGRASIVPRVDRGDRAPAAGLSGQSPQTYFSQKKVLVVGASGFLGTHLVRRFLGYEAVVCAVSRSIGSLEQFLNKPNFSFQRCDIALPDEAERVCAEFQPDYVIYAAACPDGLETDDLIRQRFNVNVLGLVNLLEGCRRHALRTRFLFGDSRKVYGNAAVPHDSNTNPAPVSSYALTKDSGWRLCKLYAALHKLVVVSVRPSLIYGPGQGQNVIQNVWEAARRGDSTIVLRGGEQTRDPIFIDDAVDAFVAAAQRAPLLANRAIVIGGREEITIRGLANLILEVSGSDAVVVGDSTAVRLTDMNRSVCDLSEAKQLLGWYPKTGLREGLQITLGGYVAERSIA